MFLHVYTPVGSLIFLTQLTCNLDQMDPNGPKFGAFVRKCHGHVVIIQYNWRCLLIPMGFLTPSVGQRGRGLRCSSPVSHWSSTNRFLAACFVLSKGVKSPCGAKGSDCWQTDLTHSPTSMIIVDWNHCLKSRNLLVKSSSLYTLYWLSPNSCWPSSRLW